MYSVHCTWLNILHRYTYGHLRLCYRVTQMSMSLEYVDTLIKKTLNSAICTLYMAQDLTQLHICTFASMLPSYLVTKSLENSFPCHTGRYRSTLNTENI